MNVRITPRGQPQRTDLYSGIVGPLLSDGTMLRLQRPLPWLVERALEHGHAWDSHWTPPRELLTVVELPLRDVAEIALDEDGAVT